MNKVLTAILTAAGSVLAGAAVPIYFRLRTRRNAAESQPKIEALLDELISLVKANRSDLERIVLRNELTTVDDERRNRDLSIHIGGDHYSVSLSTRLVGRKAGRVTFGLHRYRGDHQLNVYWPDCMEYWPMEAWLKERLDRLDALIGKTSRQDRVNRILSRFDGKDDEEDPPNSN